MSFKSKLVRLDSKIAREAHQFYQRWLKDVDDHIAKNLKKRARAIWPPTALEWEGPCPPEPATLAVKLQGFLQGH